MQILIVLKVFNTLKYIPKRYLVFFWAKTLSTAPFVWHWETRSVKTTYFSSKLWYLCLTIPRNSKRLFIKIQWTVKFSLFIAFLEMHLLCFKQYKKIYYVILSNRCRNGILPEQFFIFKVSQFVPYSYIFNRLADF